MTKDASYLSRGQQLSQRIRQLVPSAASRPDLVLAAVIEADILVHAGVVEAEAINLVCETVRESMIERTRKTPSV